MRWWLCNYDKKNNRSYTETPIQTYYQEICWGCSRKTSRAPDPRRNRTIRKSDNFKMLAKIGTSAYKLALPASLAIHNIFHISLLKPYQDNRFPSQIKELPPPIQIEGENKSQLNEIIDSRIQYNKLPYRARWKRYSREHYTVWNPGKNFNNVEQSVQRFPQCYPERPGVDTRHDQ